MQTKTYLTVALIASGISCSSLADENLAPIIITATRTAQSVDATLAAVSVIDRETISRSQARNLHELFAGLPGVQLTNSGGYGKVSGIHLRGTNSSHVVVLIDGVRIGSATTGGTSLGHLPLASIERIEIVRGPASSLYGADAIGGVIQIFTRRAQGQPELHAGIGSGSHNTRRANVGFSAAQGQTNYALDASRFTTHGFHSLEGAQTDRNGYQNSAVHARVDHQFTNDHSLGLSLLHSAGNNHYDNLYDPRRHTDDTKQQIISTHWDIALSEIWQSHLSVSESRDESQNYIDDITGDKFNTRRKQISWQHDIQLTARLLTTLGAEHQQERIYTTTSYSREQRKNTAFLAQGQLEQGRHNWQLGLRHDDNNTYGRHITGNLAWGYRLSNGMRLSASHGTAYKAPSFNDLYYPFMGNPDLQAESSASSELGLQDSFASGHWQLRAYHTSIKDLIAWTPDASGYWLPDNVNRARINGLEFDIGHKQGNWQLGLTLNLTDARDNKTDKRLIYRARETARFSVGHQYNRLHSQLDWLISGKRYHDEANSQKIGGYAVLNTMLRYKLDKNWHIEARIDNLLDKSYQEVRDYHTAGRTIFAGINYRQ
ncbi:MAG: TonB-dependent receptor [Thiohalomonadaceae bacterium]